MEAEKNRHHKIAFRGNSFQFELAYNVREIITKSQARRMRKSPYSVRVYERTSVRAYCSTGHITLSNRVKSSIERTMHYYSNYIIYYNGKSTVFNNCTVYCLHSNLCRIVRYHGQGRKERKISMGCGNM